MIWNRVPKANLVGAAILNLGVYYATVHFKDGATSSLEILKDKNMGPCENMMKGNPERLW